MTDVSADFMKTSRGILRSLGSLDESPWDLVDKWQLLTDECEVGYRWDISEFDNEVRCRQLLDDLFCSTELQQCSELTALKNAVAQIDLRFRSLLQLGVRRPGRDSWYTEGVLKSAGVDYATYFQKAHGIIVDRCQ